MGESEIILTESELKRGASDAILGKIACFAIESQFARVLAPCQDTLRDTKGHFLRQRAKMFDSVSAVPELMRIENHDVKNADRMARQAAKLKIPDNSLVKRLVGEAARIDRMRPILEKLQALSSSMTRSVEMKRSSATGVRRAEFE